MKNQDRAERGLDQQMAWLFAVLSIAFIGLMATDTEFFEWAFSRHHNMMSWYIRPIFMIPICYSAFKRKASYVSATIFLILTSMFWFPRPDVVDPKVTEFLAMERAYLTGGWTLFKIAVTSIVPLSMGALIYVLWKRNVKAGIGLLIGIAFGKIIWSIAEGGVSGFKTIVPALLGLTICIGVVFWWYKKKYK